MSLADLDRVIAQLSSLPERIDDLAEQVAQLKEAIAKPRGELRLTRQQLAEAWGQKFFALRHPLLLPSLPMDAALDKALSIREYPVVVADQADNAGGGAPSDSTFVLRALLERGVKNAAVAMMWDPIVVRLAMSAGVGATMNVRLGGKMGPMSGDPLDLTVTVADTLCGF